jgi:two-component system response regulator YcbB
MRFFLVDDDEAIRSMLTEIIEDYDLGEVVGEADNGAAIDGQLLTSKAVDILIIDLLMPVKDGIETVRDLNDSFTGKIVMLSQVEDKEMIGNAYLLGVHFYITKPLNRLEVLGVIQNLTEHIRLQAFIGNIEKNLTLLHVNKPAQSPNSIPADNQHIIRTGQYLLTELGMIGESGGGDLLAILEYLLHCENNLLFGHEIPSLKDIFNHVAIKRLGLSSPDEKAIKKEAKALEQRLRRTIFQGLMHLASLGITDYTNPKFEEFAPKFFDFTEIRKMMLHLQNNMRPSISDSRINIKRFVKVLFLESKKR